MQSLERHKTEKIEASSKSEDAVIRLGCSATNFSQTTLLSMVTAFAYMAMTAKSESRSVIIIMRSQVRILRIKENDLSTSVLSMAKRREFLEARSRLGRRCFLHVVCSVRRPRWIHNPTVAVASSDSLIETVPDFRKMAGIASDGPHFSCNTWASSGRGSRIHADGFPNK